jgi:AraC-type DNA-binding domain-containing proteins
MKSWYKKIYPDDVILFFIKRELTEEEVAAGIVLNEYNNVPTGIDFLDKFAGTLKRIRWSTPKDYAKLLGMKSSDLNIVLHTLTGNDTRAWIDHLILLGVNELLEKTNRDMYTISKDLGFSHQSMLSRFCLQQTKLSPNELRVKLRRMNGTKNAR